MSFQADAVNQFLGSGRKPLHIVADFGQKEVMEFLIAKGANINVGVDVARAHTRPLVGVTDTHR